MAGKLQERRTLRHMREEPEDDRNVSFGITPGAPNEWHRKAAELANEPFHQADEPEPSWYDPQQVEERPAFTRNSGCVYTGEWRKGTDVKEGRGLLEWPDGSVYRGWFQNSKRNGFGKMISVKGIIYEGHWLDNKYEG